jgi:hypothetical protein
MQKTLPFDPVGDFGWISLLGTYPFVVGVKSDSPYKTVGDLVAQAKRNPGKMHFPGPLGTLYHLTGEMFNSMARTDIVHFPYKGGSDALTELLGGRMDVIFEAVATAQPHIQSGAIRALAVTSGDPCARCRRSPPLRRPRHPQVSRAPRDPAALLRLGRSGRFEHAGRHAHPRRNGNPEMEKRHEGAKKPVPDRRRAVQALKFFSAKPQFTSLSRKVSTYLGRRLR